MARSDKDKIDGTGGDDHLNGGARDDFLSGLAGNDRLNGGAGNDILDGGAGSDAVKGDSGNDILIYRAAENIGSADVYDGGSDVDTLRLILTSATYYSAAFQSDLARFNAFLAANVNPNNQQANNREFTFSAFNLTVSKIENLDIVIENNAPTTAPVTLAAIAEDSAGRLITQAQLLADATDPDGNALSAVNLTIASGNGSLIDNGNGTWTYLPALNDDTAVTFSYSVTDGSLSAAGTAILDLTPVNDAPVAGNNAASSNEDTAVTLSAAALLANDSDVEGDALTIVGVGNGAHGTAVLNVDGSVTYTPNLDFNGIDTFTYTVSDGHGGTATGEVAVTVIPVNDRPRLINPIADQTIQEDQPFSFTIPANTFLEVDGDALTYTATRGDGGPLPDWVHFDPATRTFSGTPPLDFNGIRNIRVTAGDGTPAPAAFDVFQVTIAPVNDAPVRTTGAVFLSAINEDATNPGGKTIASLLGGAFADFADQVVGGSSANAFAGIAVSGNNSVAQGVWQWSSDGTHWNAIATSLSLSDALVLAPTTQLRFIPAPNHNGSAPALHVHLIDDSAGAVATGSTVDLVATGIGGSTRYSADTVAIFEPINPVNDAPLARPPWGLFLPGINEDATGPAGAPVSVLVTVPEVFDIADSVPGSSAPDAFAGIAIIGNETGPGQGTWQWSSDGVTWTTIPADGDPVPLSNAHALTLTANALLRFIPTANYNGSSPPLQVRVIEDSAGPVANGSLRNLDLTGTGGTTQYSGDVVQIYLPIAAVNDAPIATLDSVSLGPVDEDTADPAGATIMSVVLPAFSDPVDIVAGGSQANALAGIAINANATTAAHGAWQWLDGAIWQTVASDLSETAALVLAADALLRFLPAPDFNGAAPSLTARLIDDSSGPLSSGSMVDLASGTGGVTPYSAGTVTIHAFIDAVNDAPEVSFAGLSALVDEDTPLAIGGFSVFDRDAVTAPISTTLSAAHGTVTVNNAGLLVALLGNGTDTVTLVGSQADINAALAAAGNIVYRGNQHFNGDDLLTVTVNDGGATGSGGHLADTTTLAIGVNPLSDAPVAVDDSLSAVAEDSGPRTIAAAQLLANDLDPDNLTAPFNAGVGIVSLGGVVGGTVALDIDGNVVFTPTGDFNGTASFAYVVQDADGNLSAPATASFEVTPVNDAPAINAPSIAYPVSPFQTTVQVYFNGFEQPGSDVSPPQIDDLNDANVFSGDPSSPDNFLLVRSSLDHSVATVASGVGVDMSELLAITAGSANATGGHVGMSFYALDGATLTFDWRFTAGTDHIQNNDYAFFAVDGEAYFLANVASGTTEWATPAVTLTGDGLHKIGFGAVVVGWTPSQPWSASGLRIDNVTVTQPEHAGYATTITDLSISDVDADPDLLRISLSVDEGSLQLLDPGGLTAIDPDGLDGDVLFEGTQSAINAALADGVVYTSLTDVFGADTLTVTVSDLGHTGAGGALIDTHQLLLI